MKENIIINAQQIQNHIYTIRGQQVMVDRDLAELYGVEPKRLNEQVKRNIERFPEQFRFQLTEIEKNELVANCDRFKTLKHSSSLPYVFTEQGVSMLSAVLRSKTAIDVSIKIMDSFVNMRKFLLSNVSLFQRLDSLESKHLQYKLETDEKFNKLFNALEQNDSKPKQGVFFDGQIFDAYVFMSGLIKEAKKSIVLIDNYIDETTLIHLSSKSALGVKVTILTKSISKSMKLDLQKHNAQYNNIEIKELKHAHDRFLLIDEKIYHLGASLKDLGKKWFAFSLMEEDAFELKRKISEVLDDQ